MTQGIRDFTNARFAKHLPKFQSGDMSGSVFRKKVMEETIAKFQISVASAATHYNHALKTTRLATPEMVEGLGRPEDKKGGRPVLNPVTVVNTRSGKVVAEGISKGAAEVLIVKAGVLKNGDPKLSLKAEAEAEAAPAA